MLLGNVREKKFCVCVGGVGIILIYFVGKVNSGILLEVSLNLLINLLE